MIPPPPLPLFDDLPGLDGDPVETVAERLAQDQVRAALGRLTPDQRQVIALKYLEGWENESVAQALEKSVGTIKSLQHRAIETLRRMLLPKKEEIYGSQD